MTSTAVQAWRDHADAYAALIDAGETRDAVFLREHGVTPTVLDWIGDVSAASVLDAGCGPGWLHRTIRARDAHACDLNVPVDVPAHVRFRVEDLRALSYDDEMFDVIVSSLVLMWVDDLDAALTEFWRVARHGARFVCSLTHPYFYRSYRIDDAGRVVLTRPLGDGGTTDISIAGSVGPFPHFSRQPNDYINGLIRAGWVLDEVKDWFVDMDAYRAAGITSSVARTGDVPTYMFVRAHKP